MKPDDLDDPTPVEPDAALLTRVRTRSISFRRRRTVQRVTSIAAGVLVLAVAGGIVLVRGGSSGHPGISTGPPGPTTTAPDVSVAQSALLGQWRPVSITGYSGPLTSPPLPEALALRFNGKGHWTGSDGCNDLGGTYSLGAEGAFHFSIGQQTAVLCTQSQPPHARISVSLGYAATSVRTSGNRLTFLDAHGHQVARYVRAGATARLLLPTGTVTAGSTIAAHIVVDNETGHELHASGCLSYFQVLLGNSNIRPVPAWEKCLQRFTFPVGTSTYPVHVDATYDSCTGGAAVPGLVRCLPGGGVPRLPVGDYHAVTYQSGTTFPAPLPITVHVVPRT